MKARIRNPKSFDNSRGDEDMDERNLIIILSIRANQLTLIIFKYQG